MPDDEIITLLGRTTRRTIALVLAAVALLAPASFAAGFRALVGIEAARIVAQLHRVLPNVHSADGPRRHPSTSSRAIGAAARR